MTSSSSASSASVLSGPDIPDDAREVAADHAASVVARAATILQQAARGDLEGRLLGLPLGGEEARLGNAVNDLLDIVDAFVRESGATLGHASRGNFWRRLLTDGLGGSFGRAAELINDATDRMAADADALAQATAARGEMADAFDARVRAAVDTVASAATEIRATADSLRVTVDLATDQAASVAAAAEEASVNVATVAEATDRLGQSIGAVGLDAMRSGEAARSAVVEVRDTHETATRLSDASSTIGSVINLIRKVAEQTNLLALNATIEAARAGEAGRGFAVVAAEVKTLASQTASATDTVEEQVAAIQTTTREVVGAIGRVGTTVEDLAAIAGGVADAVEVQQAETAGIGVNINEASMGAQEVSRHIVGLSDGVHETAMAVEQLLAAATELSTMAEALSCEVDGFVAEMRQSG